MAADASEPGGWRARLELGFRRRGERTVLATRRHEGPLVVQSPFYPEGGPCHVYVLHPPGGIVGGDALRLDARLEAGSHALLTTPAAGKVYRSAGPLSRQEQVFTAGPDSVLEWLPQETILFDGCHVRLTTRVALAPRARFLGWEMVALGRPAAGESYRTGRCRTAFELWRGGSPLVVERSLLDGAGAVLDAPWGLRGQPVTGTLLGTSAGPEHVAAVREQCGAPAAGLHGVSLLGDTLVARYLGPQAEPGRRWLLRVWEVLRPLLLGRPGCPPRIWAT